MGDVAMTAPVLEAFAERYPQYEIVMLTRAFYKPFFFRVPKLRIHNVDLAKYHRGSKGLWRLFHELRYSYPFDFDLVIDLQDKIYSRLLRKFYRLAGVKTIHMEKGRDEKKALTRRKKKVMRQLPTSIDRYADAFRRAGFELPTPTALPERPPRPAPQIHGIDYIRREGEKWLGIAPFAQHRGKVYPIVNIKRIIGRLIAEHPEYRIFIFGGGPAEKASAASLVEEYPAVTSAIGMLTLEQEMDLMANLDLMLSMDSSAMHMASLLGVRVVSVWGATHPYAGFLGLGQSPEDAVQLAELECRPCSVYGHKECWRGDYACMETLPWERVYNLLLS